MKVSIAIPTYECYGIGWMFIVELLNSIYKQTYKNYEIIISDQSSDEDTKKIVDFYMTKMNIIYI